MNTIFAPVMALIGWTFVMWVWMYATRIPAMRAARINPARIKQKSDLDPLPIPVKQIADNYNHLHEQPVLFYAVALTLALTGGGGAFAVMTAWLYVVLRIAHSLVQATTNFTPVRFFIFVGASVVLFVLWIVAALQVFAG